MRNIIESDGRIIPLFIKNATVVQLILDAAQGASAGLYPDTARQTERGNLPEGAHPSGTDGFSA
ncbi:MAG: hypothetical protein O7C75_12440 [Verrucomicrobia bacterium]|nr:hypothetical protein [Verrucomicrobiota bacterium]